MGCSPAAVIFKPFPAGGYIGGGLQWLLCRDPESDLSRGAGSRMVFDADLAIHPKNGQSNLRLSKVACQLSSARLQGVRHLFGLNRRRANRSLECCNMVSADRSLLLRSRDWWRLFPSVQSFSATYIPVGLLHWVPLCPSWKTTSPACPPGFDLQRGEMFGLIKELFFNNLWKPSFFTASTGMSLFDFLSLSFAVVSTSPNLYRSFQGNLSSLYFLWSSRSGHPQGLNFCCCLSFIVG